MADALGVETIDRADTAIVIKFRQRTKVDLTTVIALVQEQQDAVLVKQDAFH